MSIDRLEPPFLDLHAATWIARDRYQVRSDARRFENWEANYAARMGLKAAVAYALQWGLEAIWARIRYLADRLRDRLSKLPGVRLHDPGRIRGGIVSFAPLKRNVEQLQQELFERGIHVSVVRVTSSRLDMEPRGLTELIRASVHYYNTEEEVDRFCQVLEALVNR